MSISLPKVSRFGEEFGYTEQILRLQLDSPILTVSEMFDINLKPISAQFDRYVKTKDPANVIDLFIPTRELRQSKADIVSQGIKVHPINGFSFTADTVDVSTNEPNCEVIHLKVALGKIINYQDIKAPMEQVKYLQNKPTVSNLEEGYDTLRIGENKFIIFKNEQVKALHICKFVFDEKVAHVDPANDICSVCGKPGATVYCHNDDKKFCTKCDAAFHLNKLMSDHKREPLSKAIVNVQKCPEHPNCNVMYYCNKCHLPICMECKVKGSHAHGECSKHKLVPIEKAYTDTMNVLRRPDSFFIDREKLIDSAIKDCHDKIKDIKMNQKSVEDEIMRIAMKAIEDARIQNAKIANEVKSTEEELIRKKEYLSKQKELIKNYKENAEPLQLLESAFRNVCIEDTFKGNKDLPKPLKENQGLIVYGRIEVTPPRVDEKKNQANEYSTESSIQVVKERNISTGGSESYSYTSTQPTADTILEPKDPHITKLTKLASRKQAKYDASGVSIDFIPFAESRILLDETTRRKLYMSFPFKGVPEPHLLFSSELQGKNIRMMHKLIDNMGITCVLVKAGTQVFGGFAASKWESNGIPKKQKCSTFLFQINKDAYIPYGGQSEEKYYMVATPETLSFGNGDLKLAGSEFERCSSTIENSFGVGYLYGSQKAKEFLAGKNRFAADIVEVWGFFAE